MTRLAICAIVMIACGGGDSVPADECGDGVIDGGEECDDGNTARGDGCFQCVVEPPVCGNGVLDFNEDCDDSNTVDGDGCSAICEQEIPERFLTATWTFKDLQGNLTTACPAGFPTVVVSAAPGAGSPINESFDCAAGTATTTAIPPGTYTVTIAVVDPNTAIYAVSFPQTLDLTMGDAAYATTIFNDAGVFGFGWQLRGANTFNVLTCAQANVTTIRASITGTTSVVDTFPCDDQSAFTSALLAGTTYSLTFQALNSAQQVVGTVGGFSGLTIEAPNKVTTLGTQMFQIAGL
jgi:cysteine-rich repeat protein